jgi:hypothetical protein
MHTKTVTDERRLLIDPNALLYGPRDQQARRAWTGGPAARREPGKDEDRGEGDMAAGAGVALTELPSRAEAVSAGHSATARVRGKRADQAT